jgi:metal-dependent amidase/aminoacylase/carboxypeptidase family protein
MLDDSCAAAGISMVKPEQPFRWSEDFGHFGDACRSLYFGLGIGEDAPGLHQPEYSFPDEVLGTGLRTFAAMIHRLTDAASADAAPAAGA